MATASINFDSSHLQDPILEQAQRHAWNRLPEQQRQAFLFQAASTNAFGGTALPAIAHEIPRSMSFGAQSITQTPTSEPNSMDRSQSAPVPMGRSASSRSVYDPNSNMLNQRSASNNTWSTHAGEQFTGEYTHSPTSIAYPTRTTLHTINEPAAFGDIHEYTPDQYIINCIPSSNSPSLSPLHCDPSTTLQVAPLTQSSQCSLSFDGSLSPSTPSTVALMTPTISSSGMSRQGSINPHFLENVSMLRLNSELSDVYPILTEDGCFSFSSDSSKTISVCSDTSNFLAFTGPPSEDFLSTAHVSGASAHALAPSSQIQVDLAEDMRRSPSISSDDSSSNASAASISSRQQRREREIRAQATLTKLLPKASESNEEAKLAPSSEQMVRAQSQDGSSKIVGLIPKAPYIRPQHPKIMCPKCDKQPNGFRGTHELERHMLRLHTKVRKGFVCIDASNDKKFLANCKHCRNKKVYGAYYNAAAHLRRAHFHPRKRGRKGKHDEKRGGSGGGDDPPMDYLRQNWMMEIEVENESKAPESPSDDANDNDVDDSFECTDYAATSYQAQPTNDTSMLDLSQYDPYANPSMFVNSDQGAAYDSITQYGGAFDPNTFQFAAEHAYMSQ